MLADQFATRREPPPKPLRGEPRHFFERAGFFKKMRCGRVCAVAFQLWYRDRTGVVKHWKPTPQFRGFCTLTNCKRLAIIIPIQVPRKK